MAFPSQLSPIAMLSSPASFGSPFSRPSVQNSQCPPHSTHRQMARLKGQTEPLKICCELLPAIVRTIGTSTSQLQNSHATTHPMHPRACHPSRSTLAKISKTLTARSPKSQITSQRHTTSLNKSPMPPRLLVMPWFLQKPI